MGFRNLKLRLRLPHRRRLNESIVTSDSFLDEDED